MAKGHSFFSGGSSSGGSSSGGKSFFSGGGSSGHTTKKHHGGGGFFGTVGHVLGQGAEDIYHTAVDSPAAVYQIGAAGVHDTGKLITQLAGVPSGGFHSPAQDEAQKLAQEPYQLPPIAAALAVQPYRDLQHPLRHPGYTALDILGLASVGAGTAARVGAATRVLKAGEGLDEAASALLKVPPRGTITLRGAQGTTLEKTAARSALGRAAQRQINDLRNRFPDQHFAYKAIPLGVRTQTGRIGRAMDVRRATDVKIATASAGELRFRGRGIKPFSPEGRALVMVAEGTTPETVIASIDRDLRGATGTTAKRLLRDRKLAEGAKKYLGEVDGRPVITDPKLKAIYDLQHEVSLGGDVTQAEMGLATPEEMAAAIQKPGRIYSGAEMQLPRLADAVAAATNTDRLLGRSVIATAGGKGSLLKIDGADATVRFRAPKGGVYTKTVPVDDLHLATGGKLVGAEDFSAGQHYVGSRYTPSRGSKSSRSAAQMGQGGVANVGRAKPTRLTHQLTGGLIHKGTRRYDAPAIVAENRVEAEKYAAAIRSGRDLYNNVAQDTPDGLKNPVAIKDETLFGKSLPAPVRDAVELYRSGATLDPQQTSLLSMAWQTAREHIFPKDLTKEAYYLHPDDLRFKGVKWIEQGLLGSLNRPPLLAGLAKSTAGARALSFVDLVNNAERIAILYLKPAYITPNLLGNAFVTLVQQGWAAPQNVAKAAGLMKRLGPRNSLVIDEGMGEGLMRVLGSEHGRLAGLANPLASFFSKIVDVPFRRASFVYEARKELNLRGGHMKITKAEVDAFDKLLNDPAERDRLHIVFDRANRALLDYGDLTPFEQNVVRRILFFYPWLKASTRYAADYLRDHPTQAAILGNLGQQGEQAQASLGPLPSWAQAEGLFPVGGSSQQPLVLNPTAAGVLSQPAQLAAEVGSLLNLTPGTSGYEARQSLTPFVDAILTAITKKDSFGRDAQGGIKGFGHELYSGLPGLTLAQRILQDQSGRTFPMNWWQSLGQFGVGGVFPKPVNKEKLNKAAYLEKYGKTITVAP